MARESIPSKMSILGHPIHPMLIHFPVAALLMLIPADLAYLYTADSFWARASLWLVGVGTVGGWVSGAIGFMDLVLVREIRNLIAAWCHAILAVMLLSISTLNWLLRIVEPHDEVVSPWGLYLSLLSGLMIALASLLGGLLVYDQAVAVSPDKMAERRHGS
ncbi:DUF2231 domain-containing protein [Allohahella sp. A8]|uniref:DUF2231 domain-containing protein n=1 Tax=Allohahella sp. A8 TaxID=3141461 RepID=UPI003A7FEE67